MSTESRRSTWSQFCELLRIVRSTQRADGGWDAYAYYGVWGSDELTTAFCLEAIAIATGAGWVTV